MTNVRPPSDLTIVSETTVAEAPRGRDGHEILRLTFTKAKTAEGRDVAWHSLRVFFRDNSGQFRPGKQGVTIRGAELAAIAAGFAKTVAGAQPAAEKRELLPHEEYALRRGLVAR